MEENERVLSLAALFHDIGKFFQRGDSPPEEEISPSTRSLPLKYSHPIWTYEFLEKNFPPDIASIDEEKLAHAASYHHNPCSGHLIDEIIHLADQLDAKERRDEISKERSLKVFRKVRLRSVFSRISLFGEKGEERYFPLTKIDERYDWLFPLRNRIEEDGETKYKELAKNFKKEWKSFCEKAKDLKPSFYIFFSWCMSLLEKYFSLIPTDTRRDDDISLYDHLRMTSAFALSIYRSPKKLMLVGGDISGVQDFIFRVRSPAGVRGTAKILRGRSFFISLLTDFLARFMAKKLDLTPANIIWVGGGNFILITPAGIEEALKNIEKEIQENLFSLFRGELGLVLAWKEFDINVAKDFGSCLEEIGREIGRKKKQKFPLVLEPFIEEEGDHCRVCGTFERGEEDTCSWCRRFEELGKRILDAKMLLYSEKTLPRIDKEGFLKIPLGGLGCIYIWWKDEKRKNENLEDLLAKFDLPRLTSTLFISSINDFTSPFGLWLIATNVPRIENREAIPIKFRERGEIGEEKGDVAPTSLLSLASKGSDLLGVIRMDVDHLGLIISTGLPRELRTPSRIATLSRLLNYFFSGYVNKFARDIKCESKWAEEALSSSVYLGYSGGDDLFAIGPWDRVIHFSHHLRDKFKQFSCHPSIDLSAGFIACGGSFPIGRAAFLSGEAEKNAKKGGRKSISAFNVILNWDLLSDCNVFGLGKRIGEEIESEKISRRFIFKLLEAIEREKRKTGFFWPLAYYEIVRNIKDRETKEWILKELEILENKAHADFLSALKLVLIYTKLITGGKDGED